MRLAIVALLTLGILCGNSTSAPKDQEKPDPSRVSKLMGEKLKNAQLLLEGLALSDFKKVTKAAEGLMDISKKAEWFVLKTAKYEVFSNDFRRSVDTVISKAKDKNLDGATLAYMEMTMTCVKCHQYCREERDARLPLKHGDGIGE